MSVARNAEQDAKSRYERAQAIVDSIRARWERQKCPLLAKGGSTGKVQVVHPLLKLLQDAERDADRYFDRWQRTVAPAHRGPQPSAVVGPSIGESPAAALRSVS